LPGERKYTLWDKVAFLANVSRPSIRVNTEVLADLRSTASWQDRSALEKSARRPDRLRGLRNCDFSAAAAPFANARRFPSLPVRPSHHQAIPDRLRLLPSLSRQDRSGSEASAQLQRLASSFRTAAAELPTLSTVFCSSARDIPSSLVQYFTSQLSLILILLRSGASLFVRLSISTPSNIFVDRQRRAKAW
jgi:hypothetical protein